MEIMAMDQYLLNPINTIFKGMNIHLPAILMWTTGVQGFDTLPYHGKKPSNNQGLHISPCNQVV